MPRLIDPEYLSFPFRVLPEGAKTSQRRDHVREQIEQVLFTAPRERVFRPEFGAGVNRLVFEPNASAHWELTRQRLLASLAEALRGEVDPSDLGVDVQAGQNDNELQITVSYRLATIGQQEQQQFTLPGSPHG
jgi:hypothetical protein